ncbi:MAG: MarR family transcriptional regulator [Methanomicrobiaceae archaeon]|nr:MarR family transcriptional regulator [Methanomicrobiaceae archaeon]
MQEINIRDIPLGGLISIIYRSRNIYLNNMLKMTGISPGQLFAFITISKEENITQERIAGIFYMDKGTVARAVRKLEDSGYICRTPDPENRRAHMLCLTSEGWKVLPVIEEILNKWDRDVSDGISGEDMEKLYLMLRRICEKSLLTGQDNQGGR